jgi:hypothetical protein
MSDVVNKQFLESRILLERLRQERATLNIALHTHNSYRNDPNSYFGSWPEFETYTRVLFEAIQRCNELEKTLEKQLPE